MGRKRTAAGDTLQLYSRFCGYFLLLVASTHLLRATTPSLSLVYLHAAHMPSASYSLAHIFAGRRRRCCRAARCRACVPCLRRAHLFSPRVFCYAAAGRAPPAGRRLLPASRGAAGRRGWRGGPDIAAGGLSSYLSSRQTSRPRACQLVPRNWTLHIFACYHRVLVTGSTAMPA